MRKIWRYCPSGPTPLSPFRHCNQMNEGVVLSNIVYPRTCNILLQRTTPVLDCNQRHDTPCRYMIIYELTNATHFSPGTMCGCLFATVVIGLLPTICLLRFSEMLPQLLQSHLCILTFGLFRLFRYKGSRFTNS